MTIKSFVKAMLAGMGLPSLFLPFAYTVLYFYKGDVIQENPLQFIPMYLPILFGIANVINLKIGARWIIKGVNNQLWATGAILGFIVSIVGVFVFHIPTLVFGFTGDLKYFPILLLPIIYGAIFRFIIKWLNNVLEIY
jgi:hypothetical protein